MATEAFLEAIVSDRHCFETVTPTEYCHNIRNFLKRLIGVRAMLMTAPQLLAVATEARVSVGADSGHMVNREEKKLWASAHTFHSILRRVLQLDTMYSSNSGGPSVKSVGLALTAELLLASTFIGGALLSTDVCPSCLSPGSDDEAQAKPQGPVPKKHVICIHTCQAVIARSMNPSPCPVQAEWDVWRPAFASVFESEGSLNVHEGRSNRSTMLLQYDRLIGVLKGTIVNGLVPTNFFERLHSFQANGPFNCWTKQSLAVEAVQILSPIVLHSMHCASVGDYGNETTTTTVQRRRVQHGPSSQLCHEHFDSFLKAFCVACPVHLAGFMVSEMFWHMLLRSSPTKESPSAGRFYFADYDEEPPRIAIDALIGFFDHLVAASLKLGREAWVNSFATSFRESFFSHWWEASRGNPSAVLSNVSQLTISEVCHANYILASASSLANHFSAKLQRPWIRRETQQWIEVVQQIRGLNILAITTCGVVRHPLSLSTSAQHEIHLRGPTRRTCLSMAYTAAVAALQLANVDSSDSSAAAGRARDFVSVMIRQSTGLDDKPMWDPNKSDFWSDTLPFLVQILPLVLPHPPSANATTGMPSKVATSQNPQSHALVQLHLRRLVLSHRLFLGHVLKDNRGRGSWSADEFGGGSSKTLNVWFSVLNCHRLALLQTRLRTAITHFNHSWRDHHHINTTAQTDKISRLLTTVHIVIAQVNSHLSLFTVEDSDDLVQTLGRCLKIVCAVVILEVHIRPLLRSCLCGVPFQCVFAFEKNSSVASRQHSQQKRPFHDLLFVFLPLINECTRTLRVVERALEKLELPFDKMLELESSFTDSIVCSWINAFKSLQQDSWSVAKLHRGFNSAWPVSLAASVKARMALLRVAGIVASLNFGGNFDNSDTSPYVEAFAKTLKFSDVWLQTTTAFSSGTDAQSVLDAGKLFSPQAFSADARSLSRHRFIASVLLHPLYTLRGARYHGSGPEARADYNGILRLSTCLGLHWQEVQIQVLLQHTFGRCDDWKGFQAVYAQILSHQKAYSSEPHCASAARVAAFLDSVYPKLIEVVPRQAVDTHLPPKNLIQALADETFRITVNRLVIIVQRICERNRSVIDTFADQNRKW